MIAEDPNWQIKLAALRALQADGQAPRVAELCLVAWPDPDGPIYYATRVAADVLEAPALLDRLDGPIELRLGEGIFLELPHDAGIADDAIDLDFWDGDGELTRLTITHGAGVRAEAFYYFPDVDLLLSEWWGHLQPPSEIPVDRVRAHAETGFRSSNLPLPSRAFFSGCQAVFGGLLNSQDEINEGDCPYSRHLGDGTPTSRIVTDSSWKRTDVAPAAGWLAVGFDDSAWLAAFEIDNYGAAPWGTKPTFPTGTPAKWVWDHDGRGDFVLQPKVLYFRKEFVAAAAVASLVITADNSFVAYLNGAHILSGSNWEQSFLVKLSLTAGATYCLAIVGTNSDYLGAMIAEIAFGLTGLGFGNLDPATAAPFTDCPRNSQAVCIARLGDSLSYLAFDTVPASHIVHETKGPNLTVTSRGNENNLKRPLRVIAGRRHVTDLDLLTFVVEPDINHPDGGSVKCLFAVCEGPVRTLENGKINDLTIGAQHRNYMLGFARQPQTSFSPTILNYSGTALFLGVAQGDFTKSAAEDLRGEIDVEGLQNVRVYTSPEIYTEQYTTERGWWLLHMLRNKRWGYGLDARRVRIQDFLDVATWFKELVAQKNKDGSETTGPRSQFNAELIDRTAQQQINDLCLAGRLGLPFADRGLLRVVPLRRASELFSPTVFTDQGFWGALNRQATPAELAAWLAALFAAGETSQAAQLAECRARLEGLFHSSEYTARARTDPEFVQDCYRAYLRRNADAGGLAFWLDQLVTAGRDGILEAFGESTEFINDCTDQPVATFADRSEARNICLDRPAAEGGKTTLTFSQQTDADLVNRIVLTFDDQANQNSQTPLTFESIEQQLRAGRSFGDTSRRAVPRDCAAFGVTSIGEAGRLGNLLLDLGEFDEGGLQNNLRAQFVTWYLEAVELHKYQVIRLESDRLDAINEARLAKGLEAFHYFRIRSLKRLADLKVEISAQAYPRAYYDRLEMLTVGPSLPPSGGEDPDPDNPDDPGVPGRRPFALNLIDMGHNDDQIFFTIGNESVMPADISRGVPE